MPPLEMAPGRYEDDEPPAKRVPPPYDAPPPRLPVLPVLPELPEPPREPEEEELLPPDEPPLLPRPPPPFRFSWSFVSRIAARDRSHEFTSAAECLADTSGYLSAREYSDSWGAATGFAMAVMGTSSVVSSLVGATICAGLLELVSEGGTKACCATVQLVCRVRIICKSRYVEWCLSAEQENVVGVYASSQ